MCVLGAACSPGTPDAIGAIGAKPAARDAGSHPRENGTADGSATPVPGGDATGDPATITLNEYRIEGDLTVPAGVPNFLLRNRGYGRHIFVIAGVAESPEMPQRANVVWSPGVALAPGTYDVFCSIGDHRARGMQATLTVTDP